MATAVIAVPDPLPGVVTPAFKTGPSSIAGYIIRDPNYLPFFVARKVDC